MTSDALRTALVGLGVSQADFARLIGVTPRAVSLWMSAEREIPGPAEAYLRLLQSLPLGMRQVEIQRLQTRGTKMRNGMYGIQFQYGAVPAEGNYGHGVLTFEDGLIYGVDIGGTKYDGGYVVDQETGQAQVKLKITFPPNGQAVFGISNPYEWSVDVIAEIDPKADRGATTARTSMGHAIATVYTYMRPLPQAA